MLIRKKVCFLTSVHPVFDVRIFHKEAKSLVKNGYHVSLVAQYKKNEIVDGIRIVPISIPKNRFVRMTRTIWTIYRKAVKVDADIYHFHDPELMIVGLLLRFHGKKIIYDMHENLSKQIKNKHYIHRLFRNVISRIASLAERILLADVPIIFAEVSYRKDFFWAKRFKTIQNMPLVGQIDSLRIVKKPQTPSIGYIGSVYAERGSTVTIEALGILKMQGIEPRFECIGEIETFHQVQLLKLCEQYNLQKVVLRGRMPAHVGWSIIARCIVGLALLQPLPNYVESYPTKIFEYMTMGLPVIVSDFPLYRHLVEEAKCGICVDPSDVEAIAGAIRWILDHPIEARQMGQNGRRSVEEKYNWDIEEKKLIQFYDMVLQPADTVTGQLSSSR